MIVTHIVSGAIMSIALIVLRKLRLRIMVFRIHVRVLQVAVANGRAAVERELRKFLKVRNAEDNTGVGYFYNGSKTTHLGVCGIDF